MQNLSAAHWPNIRWTESEQGNRFAFSSHKFNFEGSAIFVAMHHCSYIAPCQIMLFDIMCENDSI